jgi:6-phosphogluconolactonase/glucosamine-6-phosphate isomerase/deaminase
VAIAIDGHTASLFPASSKAMTLQADADGFEALADL